MPATAWWTSGARRMTCRTSIVSDGSQFTSGAACNPTLTIVALAIRQAEHITGRMARGEV